MVLKSRDYVFKLTIFKKLSIEMYSVHWYMFILKVKSPHCSGGKLVNNCINARGGEDLSLWLTQIYLKNFNRWICSIISYNHNHKNNL